MNVISRLLTDLAACLCEQIKDAGLPDPCFCGVMPGARVALDYVGNCEQQDGMAWTRLTTAYPAAGVGRVDTSLGNCGVGLGIDIEIGIIRSAPRMTEDSEPPEEGAQLEATDLQSADLIAMRQAVVCCFGDKGYDYIVGPYLPYGPEGFAVGGTMTVMVAL